MSNWITDRYPNENEGDNSWIGFPHEDMGGGGILILHKNGEKYIDSVKEFCDSNQMEHVYGWMTPPSELQWISDRYPDEDEGDEWGSIIVLRKDGTKYMEMIDEFFENRLLKKVAGWTRPPGSPYGLEGESGTNHSDGNEVTRPLPHPFFLPTNFYRGHNMSNEWITDRRPIEHDEPYVYDSFGHVCHWIKIANGEPWKPIPKCEPYVKPKRYIVKSFDDTGEYDVFHVNGARVAMGLPTREAAERIAAIFEEVMP